ncbi:MAG: PAS domain S-box protein [Flavisolibacter sp.]
MAQKFSAKKHLSPSGVVSGDDVVSDVFSALPFSAVIVNDDGQILQANRKCCDWLGFDADALNGKHMELLLQSPVTSLYNRRSPFLLPVYSKDGKAVSSNFYVNTFQRDGEVFYLIILQPASEMTVADTLVETERFKKLNRIHALISRVSEAMVRLKDLHQLLQEICNISVAEGQFRMAWIGRWEREKRNVVPEAIAGYHKGYLKAALAEKIADRFTGPTATALNEGRAVTVNDIRSSVMMKPWRELALSRGYRSLISIPIMVEGKPFGTFSLYSATEDFFTEEEVDLLKRIADDISYAVEVIHFEEIRRQTELQLQKSEEKYKLLFDASPLPIYVMDRENFRFLAVNRATLQLYGYSKKELAKMTPMDLRAKEDVPKYIEYVKSVKANGSQGVWKHKNKAGNVMHVEVITHQIVYENRKALLVILNDVTEKRKSETKIRRINKELRDLSAHLQNVREEERKQIARDIHDELGQQLTALKMDISWLAKQVTGNKEINEKMEEMIGLVNATMTSMRRITSDLRPSLLDHLGLVPAVEWLNEDAEKRYGVSIFFHADEMPEMPLEVSTNLFRIYQEALTNVLRHAEAKQITSSLRNEKASIVLEICDDGKGIGASQRAKSKGFGLLGIKERVYATSGLYMLSSESGKGTCLKVEIPLKTEN